MSSDRSDVTTGAGGFRWCGRATWIAGIALILASVAVYWNSLKGPFVFDDVPSIVSNQTIEHLWPLSIPLSPPHQGETVTGRPFLNFTFALDYALARRNPAAYRAGNIAIHACAGLLLFGLVRRTLRRLEPAPRARSMAERPAFAGAAATAALWLLHPLQTESVTYVVQRAESLVALLFLLTLYGLVRGVEPGRRRGWLVVSWTACLLGMATKEIMVVTPVLVACYDRTFVAPTWRELFARRWRYYVALGFTWALLAVLVFREGLNRGGTSANAGFLTYWATQPGALVTYFARTLWPNPLIFDYGARWVTGFRAVGLPLVAVAALAIAGAAAWRRRSPFGFAVVWLLAVLAPTSLVPGARQTIAEHRMYVASAPLLAIAVVAVGRVLGRRAIAAGVVAVLALGSLTVQRNQDYRSVLAIWNDTVTKRPDNRWAHVNVGNALAEAGKPDAALSHYEMALKSDPTDSIAHYDVANAFVQLQRLPEAIEQFREALRLDPQYSAARTNLADALFRTGYYRESVALYREIIRRDADTAEMHYNLGNALGHMQAFDEAEHELGEALRRRPSYPEASYNLGCVYLQTGRAGEAIDQFERSLRTKPNDSETHNNLGAALAQLGRIDQAIVHVSEAVRLDPKNAAAHGALGQLYAYVGRRTEAIGEFETMLKLEPASAAAREALTELRNGKAP